VIIQATLGVGDNKKFNVTHMPKEQGELHLINKTNPLSTCGG